MVSILRTKLGWVGIVSGSRGLTCLIPPSESKKKILKKLGGDIRSSSDDNIINRVRKDLVEYMDGRDTSFNYPIDLQAMPPFTQRVLKIVRTIPYSETRSYSWVAERVGGKRFSRAVGQALSRNPLPIIIPCHRVIKSDGTAGGFTGGIHLKRKLLRIEKAAT